MGIFTSIAVFFVIWWVVLFAILPFGIRSQWEDGEPQTGTEPGAPVKSNIPKKFIVTTVVAILVFIGFRIGLSFGAFDSFTGA